MDLANVAKIAKDVVLRYGLIEEFSQDRAFVVDGQENMLEPEMIFIINLHVKQILEESRLVSCNYL